MKVYGFDMKTKGKDLVKQIKAEKNGQTRTVSFRLPVELADDFAKQCDKQEVSANSVIIKLVRGFLEDLK